MTTVTPRWLARHLAALHDTDAEREGFVPARLAGGVDLSASGVFTPEKYGAAGDGVIDDTTAVQAAVNACPVNGTVYFTKQYRITAAIVYKPYRSYIGTGDSRGGLIVKAGTHPVAALVASAYANNGTTSDGPVTIRDMSIKYEAGNTYGHGILGLNYYSTIEGNSISTTPESGIVMADKNSAGGTITNTAVENRIRNNRIFTPGKHGIWVQDVATQGKNTDGYLTGNIVAFSGDVAIRSERAAGWWIADNHVYACGNAGAPASLATVAGAGGFHLTNCWNTYITNNEVDGFGNVTNGGTHFAYNIEQLTGRPTVVTGNTAAANENLRPASNYRYYRVNNSGGAGVTASVVMADNVAHCDSTGGASSVWASLQANGGTLNLRMSNNFVNGPSSTPSTGSGTLNIGGPDATTTGAAAITGAVETMSRDTIDPTSGAPSPSAGTLGLTYFTADQALTVGNLTSASRGTAQAGATLAKMALYSVDGSGNLTCIARTASDTTLWQSANGAFTRAVADNGQGGAVASVPVVAGQRYAFAVLHVGSTTAPTLAGKGGIAGLGSLTPRRSGYLTGQTDVPASITAATVAANTASGNYYYGRLS